MAKIFLALDFPDANSAWPLVKKVLPINPYLKVGLELFVAEGPAFLSKLKAEGAEIFLDLKFHDIPNTVAGAVRSAVRGGVDYLNVHCGGGKEMMKAAAAACAEEAARSSKKKPSLLGVTVLTSLDDMGLQEIGFPRSTSAQVKHFVDMAVECGLDGVVCSPQELTLVRSLAGDHFITMVPGIRPSSSQNGDQKRVLTPREAVQAGAHCLVVGRPVTQAPNPVQALQDILAEVAP